MPGLGARTAERTGSVITPDREVEVHFDVAETVLEAPPFSLRRYASQIVPDRNAHTLVTNVELLKSGYWILSPLQGRLDLIHETTEMGSATMLLSEFNAIVPVKQEPLYRTPTEILGLTTGAGGTLATSANDLFFQKRHVAGSNWNLGLTGERSQPTYDSQHIKLDRVMDAITVHEQNTGYLLRFQCPATNRHVPDNLWSFYFGGPLFEDGYGEYCLLFKGSGIAILYEFHHGDWARRHEWRYALPHQVMGQAHTVRVLPHVFRYMEFKAETNEQSEPNLLFHNPRLGPYASAKESPIVELYTVNPSLTGQPSLHPNGWVTGAGRVRVDVRRDLRLAWQISRLQYPTLGQLYDYPFGIPCFADTNALMKVRTNYYQTTRLGNPSALGDIVTTVADAETELDLAGDNTTGWSLPPAPAKVRVKLDFVSNDAYLTPFLRGYTAELIGAIRTKIIGEKTGGVVDDYQITGPSADPSHETATLHLEEIRNELESLRTRAGQNVRVQTSYDPNDTAKKSVLFQGRVARADAKLMGWERGQEYPSPEWRSIALTCVGEWQRLQEQLMIGQFDFSRDDTADETEWVNGSPPPWTIPQVVRHLISYCGYTEDRIDVTRIAENPTRMPLEADSGGAWFPSPFLSVGDYIQRLLRDYLGAYLTWNANAINGGLRGMWQVYLGPTIPPLTSPLYSFTNDEPPAPVSGVTLLGRTEAYPANTTFIVKESFNSFPVPPEANAVMVVTTGDLAPGRAAMGLLSCAINYRSYNPPGGPNLDDPTDPDNIDYLGRFVPLVITDPLLAVGNTPAERQAALDLFTRRIFNIACRGAKRHAFEAPLVLVEDPADAYLDRKRPLRYGDFVRVDGIDCLVRAVNPSFSKDHMQMAQYETEVYRAPE